MAWKRQFTCKTIDVDIRLDEFSPEQILQELINRRLISEGEATAIKRRALTEGKESLVLESGVDDIEIARVEARRGRKTEAMVYLSRALGRDFRMIFDC